MELKIKRWKIDITIVENNNPKSSTINIMGFWDGKDEYSALFSCFKSLFPKTAKLQMAVPCLWIYKTTRNGTEVTFKVFTLVELWTDKHEQLERMRICK